MTGETAVVRDIDIATERTQDVRCVWHSAYEETVLFQAIMNALEQTETVFIRLHMFQHVDTKHTPERRMLRVQKINGVLNHNLCGWCGPAGDASGRAGCL